MPLTRDQVVGAALKVAGAYGLGDLSMRRVATELGVQAGALYWHVANKQELLIAVAERILDPGQGAATWPGTPERLLGEFRNRLLTVRDGAEIVAVAHAARPDHLPPVRDLAALLGDLGVEQPVVAAQNMIRWVLGSVLTEQTAGSLVAASSPAAAQATTAVSPSSPRSDDDTPSTDHTMMELKARFERDFTNGLTMLLAGAQDHDI